MNGHENDADSANGADSGANNGGIFSTPDLTIETENIPANVGGTPVVDETENNNSARIASAFANTDASQGPQFRSNTTTSSATGDIKLAPTTKKKSKAPFMIIIVLILAAVGGLVWAVASGKLNFDNSASQVAETTSLADAEKAYNDFANYLLYGETRDTFSGEWIYDYNYKIDTELSASTIDQAYWQKLIQLLKDAIEIYKNTKGGNSGVLGQMIQQQIYLNIVDSQNRLARFIGENTIKNFYEHGAEATKKYFDNFIISGHDDEVVSQYNAKITEIADSYLNQIETYASVGCIKDYSIDRDCALQVQSADAHMIELNVIFSRNNASIRDEAEEALQELKSNCWSINENMFASYDYDAAIGENNE